MGHSDVDWCDEMPKSLGEEAWIGSGLAGSTELDHTFLGGGEIVSFSPAQFCAPSQPFRFV